MILDYYNLPQFILKINDTSDESGTSFCEQIMMPIGLNDSETHLLGGK